MDSRTFPGGLQSPDFPPLFFLYKCRQYGYFVFYLSLWAIFRTGCYFHMRPLLSFIWLIAGKNHIANPTLKLLPIFLYAILKKAETYLLLQDKTTQYRLFTAISKLPLEEISKITRYLRLST
ncbi:MAG: hypothetical protein ACLUKE_03630, partial [Blautia wexlerae]